MSVNKTFLLSQAKRASLLKNLLFRKNKEKLAFMRNHIQDEVKYSWEFLNC